MPEAAGRTPYIAGNWKMHKTIAEGQEFVKKLRPLVEPIDSVEVGLCVPYTALYPAVQACKGSRIKVCAQNMHFDPHGAYTGEVSAPMLSEIGVQGVVLGHSERRQYFGETERRLRHQVQEALEKVEPDDLPRVVIAYEPIWAIGTGKVATSDQAQEAIAFIRALVGDRSKEAAALVRVLYGGSVKADNAAEILEQPDVDGALVGGASLDPEGFAAIVSAAAAARA